MHGVWDRTRAQNGFGNWNISGSVVRRFSSTDAAGLAETKGVAQRRRETRMAMI
jgi:hypothetical protein